MRKRVFGRRLSRNTNQRKALFRNLAASLIDYGRVTTTEAKVKAVIPFIDKLVNTAKKGSQQSSRILLSVLPRRDALKLLNDIAPRFAGRASGFVRIVKTKRRLSDNAAMVIMEWAEMGEPVESKKPATTEAQKITETRKRRKTLTTKTQNKTGTQKIRKRKPSGSK